MKSMESMELEAIVDDHGLLTNLRPTVDREKLKHHLAEVLRRQRPADLARRRHDYDRRAAEPHPRVVDPGHVGFELFKSMTGTRIEMPSILPLSSGSTREVALAAPVVVGMMFCAAALARRRSRCWKSCSTWSEV